MAKYPELIIPEDQYNPHVYATYDWAKEMDLERAAKIRKCDIRKPTKHAPFSAESFTNMIKQVVHEESKTIPFSKGTFHNWSKELKGRKRIKCAIITKAPKLLVMLALGVSYRFAKTGQEEKLAEIIGSYSPRNLYPHDVFRLSYRLNKGNIYLSLLTIENVLARHWTSKNREARRVTTRLAHITNDPSGDNFGTWYHLYGVMLFGYTHGSAMAWSVGVIEGIGSGLMSGFSAETQENKINRIGAKVGGKLRREFIKSDGLVDFIPNTDYVEPTKYLSLIENDCSLNGSIKKKDKKREL